MNPSGIRFGSAEIYSIIESPPFLPLISDSLCVGRKRPTDRDETVFLFIKMRDGQKFTSPVKDKVAVAIRTALSPRHVPKYLIEVSDIPVTINGKKVELAVKKLISGQQVKLSATVSNPESLKEYEKYRDWEGGEKAKL